MTDSKKNSVTNEPLSDKIQQIFTAIKLDDSAMLASAIKNSPDLNVVTRERLTPLILAVTMNSLDCVMQLAEKGADINLAVGGFTPLMVAVQEGYAAIAKYLIEKGANINAKNDCGLTVLMIAARDGHVDILNLLLDNGVDVHAYTADGSTALDAARQFRQSEAADALENYMRPPKSSIPADFSEVGCCIVHGDGSDFDAGNVHQAAEAGMVDIFKNMKHGDSAINTKDEYYGRTPLHWASLDGKFKTVKAIIEKGADVNLRDDREGRTALHFAAESGDVNIIKFLIEKGADVNAAEDSEIQKQYCSTHSYIRAGGYSSNTPLYIAVMYDHFNVVEILVDSGADINKKCNHDSTSIHCAAAYDRTEILKFLYENGGDINSRNDEGFMPVDFARNFGCSGTLRMLNRYMNVSRQG